MAIFQKESSLNVKSNKLTPVVLVTNLNHTKANLEHLFILFGVYGDPLRLKMFDRKICYIEFEDTEQSARAIKVNFGIKRKTFHLKNESFLLLVFK